MTFPTSRSVHRGLIVALLTVTSSFVARVGQGAAPDLRSLTIVPEAASIDEGSTATFVVIGTYSNGKRKLVTNKVTWSSSNRVVAKVAKDGTAAGITHGKATIKALINGTINGTTSAPTGRIQAEAALTVQPRLTSLSLEPQSTILLPGESSTFKLRGVYSGGTVALLSDKAHWSVDEDDGATTIDASRRATGVRGGTAMIVATVGSLGRQHEGRHVQRDMDPRFVGGLGIVDGAGHGCCRRRRHSQRHWGLRERRGNHHRQQAARVEPARGRRGEGLNPCTPNARRYYRTALSC